MTSQPTLPQSTPIRSLQDHAQSQNAPLNDDFSMVTPVQRRRTLDVNQGNSSPLKVKSLSQSYFPLSSNKKSPNDQNQMSPTFHHASQEVARSPGSLTQSQVSQISQVNQMSQGSKRSSARFSCLSYDEWESDPKVVLFNQLAKGGMSSQNLNEDLYSSGRKSDVGK